MIKINYRYYMPVVVIYGPSLLRFVRTAVIAFFAHTRVRLIDISYGKAKHRPVWALVFPEIVWDRRTREEIEARCSLRPEGNVLTRRKEEFPL